MNQRPMRPLPTPIRAMKTTLAATLIAATTACLALAAPTPARAATPAVLDQAPAGSQMVVVVPSPKALSDKIATLNQSLGLNQPAMKNVLGMLKGQAGMNKGVKDDGAFMIAVPNLLGAAVGRAQQVLVLVPVSDYDQFVSNYAETSGRGGGAEPDATGITQLTMPRGQPGYALHVDDYAVISPTRSLLEQYKAGGEAQAWLDKVGQLGAKYLKGADIAVALDIQTLAPSLRPMLRGAMANMQNRMDRAPGLDANTRQQAKMFYKVYGDMLDSAMRDGRGLVIALDMDPKNKGGIGLTYTLQFKQGTPTAKLFPGGRGDHQALTAKLPDRPYIAAMGLDAGPLNVDALVQRFLAELPADSDNAVIKMYREQMPLMKRINRFAYGWYIPQQNNPSSGDSDQTQSQDQSLGGGLLNGLAVIDTDDSKAYLTGVKQYLQQINGMSQSGPSANQDHGDTLEPGHEAPSTGPAKPPRGGQDRSRDQGPQAMTFHTKMEDHAMDVAGTPVTRFSWRMDLPTSMQQQAKPMMMLFGGKMGYTGYLAQKDGHVLSTTTPDVDLLKAGFASADQADGLGVQGPLAEVRKQALPPGGFFELYANPRGIGDLLNRFLPMMGHDPLDVPADLPPLAIGMGSRTAGVAYRTYLPTATLKYITKSIRQELGSSTDRGMNPGEMQEAQPAPY